MGNSLPRCLKKVHQVHEIAHKIDGQLHTKELKCNCENCNCLDCKCTEDKCECKDCKCQEECKEECKECDNCECNCEKDCKDCECNNPELKKCQECSNVMLYKDFVEYYGHCEECRNLDLE